MHAVLPTGAATVDLAHSLPGWPPPSRHRLAQPFSVDSSVASPRRGLRGKGVQPDIYKQRHAVECGINPTQNTTGHRLPATINSPSATKPPPTSSQSTSGSESWTTSEHRAAGGSLIAGCRARPGRCWRLPAWPIGWGGRRGSVLERAAREREAEDPGVWRAEVVAVGGLGHLGEQGTVASCGRGTVGDQLGRSSAVVVRQTLPGRGRVAGAAYPVHRMRPSGQPGGLR